MKPSLIAKYMVESDDFDPMAFLKGDQESAIEVYNGPIVRVITPLTAFTLNDYFLNNEWSAEQFDYISTKGSVFLVLDKRNHENMALIQPSTRQAWNLNARGIDWKEVKDALGEEAYQDMQTGLANYFMAQIAAKKNVTQNVGNLAMIGRTDLATNYASHLGRAKLPLANSIEAVMALQKAGKRSRNKIASLMKNQTDVKWGANGFWLLFNDWVDLAPFYGENRNYDFAKNAETIFNGDTHEWFEGQGSEPEDVFDDLDPSNLNIIRQLLVNRTLANEDGEEFVATREHLAELSDGDLEALIFDDQNESETDDIRLAIRWASNDANASSQESAYYDGYQRALASEWGLSLEKDIKWINVPHPKKKGEKLEKLGLFFPYRILEEWIEKWKGDEFEDDYFGDIHDLAIAYLEKVYPQEEYYGDRDNEYFNEQAKYHLSEIDMQPVEQEADPNQPELPLQGEPERAAPELETTTTVAIGNNLADRTTHKGVPSAEARKYAKAMNYKAGDKDIHLMAEAFLALPFSPVDEADEEIDPKQFLSDQLYYVVRKDAYNTAYLRVDLRADGEWIAWERVKASATPLPEEKAIELAAMLMAYETGENAPPGAIVNKPANPANIFAEPAHDDGVNESASDVEISFVASDEAAESLVPLLKELKKMGSQGSSRKIKIEDWDGRDSFGFDGDGASKIGEIKVAGKVVEALVNEQDPKDFVDQSVGDPEHWIVTFSSEHGSDMVHYLSDSATWTSDKARAAKLTSEAAYREVKRLRAAYPDENVDIRAVPLYRDDAPLAESEDMKDTILALPHIEHFLVKCVGVSHDYPRTPFFLTGVAQWTPHAWEANAYSYTEAEAMAERLSKKPSMAGLNVEVVPQMSDQDAAREESLLQEAIYKLSTTQIDLPKEIGQHIISWGELNIPEEALYVEE